jgi:LytS/YehU family sensor histidine kinase
VLETLVAIGVGAAMGSLATLLSWVLFGYDEPLAGVFIANAIIAAAINLLIVTIAEAVLFYRRHQREQIRVEELERENLAMRFETLKKQLDPHFLFNSLNVLSSLVRKDRDKAQDFIDEFSHIYRYTLEVIDKPVVPLREELDFARSYLFLQKIRFDDAIRIEFDVDEADLDALLPPLAIQTLLENAFKHNVATPEHPLRLRIFTTDNRLYVVNSLQPKPVPAEGKRMGFENLKNRYRLVSGALPEVILTRNEYQVKLEFVQTS